MLLPTESATCRIPACVRRSGPGFAFQTDPVPAEWLTGGQAGLPCWKHFEASCWCAAHSCQHAGITTLHIWPCWISSIVLLRPTPPVYCLQNNVTFLMEKNLFCSHTCLTTFCVISKLSISLAYSTFNNICFLISLSNMVHSFKHNFEKGTSFSSSSPLCLHRRAAVMWNFILCVSVSVWQRGFGFSRFCERLQKVETLMSGPHFLPCMSENSYTATAKVNWNSNGVFFLFFSIPLINTMYVLL